VTAALKLDFSSRAFGAALVALVLALTGAAWFVAVAPQRSHASKLATTIRSKQAELASAQHRQSAGGADPRAQLGSLRAAMPDALEMPQVVDELNALATRAGVTLDTVTPAAAVAAAGYSSVPLTVVVDGRFFAVQQFLRLVRTRVEVARQKLDASGRLFDVQSVALDQTEPAPRVTATLAMSAFYFTGATAPPLATPTTTTPTS